MTGEARASGWRRRVSLRSRMILLTAVVVAVVVAAGGVLIVVAVRAELIDSVEEVGQSWASRVDRLVQADDLPATLPVLVDGEDAAVQVVADGQVLSATQNLPAGALDLPPQPAGTTRVFDLDDLPIEGTGPYRVTARGVNGPAGSATIFVVMSLEDVEEAVASAVRVGSIGLSVLVLVLCGVMWIVIGRTLAPVERIRDRAEAITGVNLDRRVPEPVQDDEIGRLARTVNEMLARLQDSAERQRRFVADAAHELRSPIASLRAQLETARDRDGEGGVEALVPDLMAETLRMQALVDQLLLLARTDASSVRDEPRSVDIDDAVEAAVTSLNHLRLPVDMTAVEPVQVQGHPGMLQQVIRNLLENALRYAEAQVHVALSANGTHAVLTVDDDGPGISDERREDVFRRFTRLDPTRDRDGGGVGLGLAIVAEIVSAHDGTVDVAKSASGGARFTVRLPLHGPTRH